MSIRHQSPGHGDWQQARFLHLHHRFKFKPLAPLAIFDRFGARRRRSVYDRFSQFLPHRILREQRRIGDNRFDLLFQFRFVSAPENELRNKISRPPRRFTQRDAEADKVFGIHKNFWLLWVTIGYRELP